MLGYASRTGTRRNLAALRAAGWRLLVSATGVHRDEGFPFRDRQRGMDGVSGGHSFPGGAVSSAARESRASGRLDRGAGHRGRRPEVSRLQPNLVGAPSRISPAFAGSSGRHDRGTRGFVAQSRSGDLHRRIDGLEVVDRCAMGGPGSVEGCLLPCRPGQHGASDLGVRKGGCGLLRWDVGYSVSSHASPARPSSAPTWVRCGGA